MAEEMEIDQVDQVDGDDSDDSDDSDSSSDASDGVEEGEDDARANERISELRAFLAGNPNSYDAHVEYIRLLRRAGKLDVLKHAREKMSALFPLTEDLWTSWLNDEKLNARGAEGYTALVRLFERAVKDYLSVSLWLMYADFVLTAAEDRMSPEATQEAARAVFERAVAAGGLHLSEGVRLWSAYRAFEEGRLARAATPAEREQATAAVNALYRRQLSVPLLNMEETFEAYRTWLASAGLAEPTQEFAKRIQLTVAKVDERLPLEEAVAVEAPPLDAFLAYVAFEKEKGDPARVQNVFERAVRAHAVDASLWTAYVQYAEGTLKAPSTVVAVCERSVRNCPWVSHLWITLLRNKEKAGANVVDFEAEFERALMAGFASGAEYVELWLALVDFHRRQMDAAPADQREEAVARLRRTFPRAVAHLEQHFGSEADPFGRIQRYWARAEARVLKDAAAARKVWDALLKDPARVHTSWLWAEYAQLEIECMGGVDGARRIFKQALTHILADAGVVYEAFVDLERLHGTLDTFDDARRRIDGNAARDTQHREAQERHAAQQQHAEAERRPRKDGRAPRHGGEGGGGESGAAGADDDRRKRKANDEEQRAPKRRKVSESEESKERRDAQTIFVSNLDKRVDEVTLQNHFTEKVGTVVEVRLVKNQAGLSKCFAYVEFAAEESVGAALALDRQPLMDRPMLISRAMDKDKRAQNKAPAQKGSRFSDGLDPKTVFVANLPFAATSDDLKKLFEKFGPIKEVRLVEKAGKPKGYAYIEFQEAPAASAALSMDKHVFMERPLSVAISNPASRPPNPNPHLAAGRSQQPLMRDHDRPKARLGGGDIAALVPRAVKTGPAAAARPKLAPAPQFVKEGAGGEDAPDANNAGAGAPATGGSMSNAEFRKFLRK